MPLGSKEKDIRSGFSLFELLVVILIMSVSLGLFLGFNYRQQESIELKAQGHAVVQLMRAAKSTAIVQGHDNRCVYHPQENSIRTSLDQRQETLASNVLVKIQDLPVDKKTELAVFYADGSAWAETISLQTKDNAHAVSIEVEPLFGEIRLVDG